MTKMDTFPVEYEGVSADWFIILGIFVLKGGGSPIFEMMCWRILILFCQLLFINNRI